MKKILYYFGLVWMAIMLFILHSTFAYSIMPIFLAREFFQDLFVLNGYDLKIYFPYVFGGAYAFAISAIISILDKNDRKFWIYAKTVAILEFFSVALIVYPIHGDVWTVISGIYYGVYLLFAIIFYFYIKPQDKVEINVDEEIINFTPKPKLLEIVSIYIIVLEKDIEKFIKIGLSNNIDNRFNDYKRDGYNIETIDVIDYEDRKTASKEESNLHRMFSEHQYLPINKFPGWTECFNIKILEKLKKSTSIQENSIIDKELNPKYQEVIELLKQGESGISISQKLNIHTSTISRLKKEYCQ